MHRLLDKGYKPAHIELEPRWNLGREAKGGKADILVRDNERNPYLLIECKTTDSKNSEFRKEWNKMQQDGGQLFSYFQQERGVKFLCLYTSDFSADCALKYENYIINMQDNPSSLKEEKKRGYKDAHSVKELFEVWKHTYSGESSENGIFEPQIECYDISILKPTLETLSHIDSSSMQKKRHEWATILRANAVGDRGLALNKLMNLLLCKITDELENKDDLAFFWKGYNADTRFELVDRLQNLYKIGMQKYLNQSITYHSIDSIDEAFSKHFSDTAVRKKIQNIFNELKYFSNGDFNFIEVYNKEQFDKNFEILLPVVQSLQNIRFTDTKDSNILGDYFETYIHDMPQQEGQYFTPVPLVNFIINSLPIFTQTQVLDFACGAGHFLTQYAEFHKGKDITFLGIDKDSRLAKIAKIASFMHGIDSHIKADDSLKLGVIERESCNVLISNPPYSVDEFLANLTQSDTEQYELFSKNIDTEANDKIQCFLIEKASNALKSGGVLSLVLPSSLLNKGQELDIKTLQILLRDFYIISICAFGNQTFFKTGTQPIILYAIRKPQRQNTKMTNDEIYEDFIEYILQGKIEQLPSIYDNFLPLLERYATFRGFDKDELKALFSLTLAKDAQIYKNESFIEYKTAYKQILEKQKTEYDKKSAKYKEKSPFIPTQSEIEFIRQKECEKFLYFCYCIDSNPIIIKSPNENNEQKKFLGYYWSTTKGQEGIHYLNTTNIAEIQTPLYNPKNQHDTNKLNYYILQNFYAHFKENKECKNINLHSENSTIPPELQAYALKARLVDMLDFTRAEFSKAISLNPTTQHNANSANPFADSRFEMVRLEKIATISRGASPRPIKNFLTQDENGVNWIKIGDVRENEKYITHTQQKITQDGAKKSKKVKAGDFILSNSMSAGRPYILKIDGCIHDGWLLLSNIADSINRDFLYYILISEAVQQQFEKMATGSVVKNLNTDRVSNVTIPLPPLEIQRQIIAECESVESQSQLIKDLIALYRDLVSAILAKCGISESTHAKAESILPQIATLESKLDPLPCHTERSEVSQNPQNRDISPTAQYDKMGNAQNGKVKNAKNDKMDSNNGLPRVSSETLAMTEDSPFANTIPARGGAYIDSPSLAEGARGWVESLTDLLKSLPTPPKQGWDKVKLGEVCNINEKTYNPSKDFGKSMIYIDIDSIEKGTGKIILNESMSCENLPSRARRIVSDDSVIISTVRPYLKGFAYIKNAIPNSIFSTGFAVLSGKGGICKSKFLYLCFMYSNDLMTQMEAKMPKASYPSINVADIETMQIPLPPLSEQEKIISCIEAIESKITALDSTLPALESTKSQILQKYLA